MADRRRALQQARTGKVGGAAMIEIAKMPVLSGKVCRSIRSPTLVLVRAGGARGLRLRYKTAALHLSYAAL